MKTRTVTLLFTDIEKSSALWETDPDMMAGFIANHDRVLTQAIEDHDGIVFKRTGDGICAIFESPSQAVRSSLSAQIENSNIVSGAHQVRVRMAIYTGEVYERDRDYFGVALSRVSRILGFAKGGQVLVSASTKERVDPLNIDGVSFRELGTYPLRGLKAQESIFQVIHSALSHDLPEVLPKKALGQLPNPSTSFIGRSSQIAHLRSLIADRRLVNLLGSGGIGKTRLAIEAAKNVSSLFEHGVWFISLEYVTEPSLVLLEITSVLGIKELPGQTLPDAIVGRLALRKLLIVVDNCEHLTSAAASAIQLILDLAPNVHIIATAREVLGLRSEHIFHVMPLAMASDSTSIVPRGIEAVRLFVDRAMSANPKFRVTDENLDLLCRLTQRLDGIPLAIELAAARMRTLSVKELLERLDDSFSDLKSTFQDDSQRHRTLIAAMEWSYDLLSKDEQILFARLGVFAGSWSLASCEKIAGFRPLNSRSVLDLTASLVDKSLVISEDVRGETRFRLLETLRTFSRAKLKRSRQVQTVRRGFFQRMQALAIEVSRGIRGNEQLKWRRLFDDEIDNFRLAIEWGISNQDEIIGVANLTCCLATTWLMNGQFSEALRYYDRILKVLPDSEVELRARVLSISGYLRVQSKQFSGVEQIKKAVDISQNCEISIVFECNSWLATAMFDVGEYEEAERLFNRELELGKLIPGRTEGYTYLALGAIAVERGRFDEGEIHYARMIQEQKAVGDIRGYGLGICYLAHLKFLTQNPEADRLYREAIGDLASVPDFYTLAANLAAASSILISSNSFEALAQAQGYASQMVDKVGVSIDRHIKEIGESAKNLAIKKLGSEKYTEWFEEGKLLGLADVLALLEVEISDKETVPNFL